MRQEITTNTEHPFSEEWNEEIAKRIAELDSGEVKPIPWDEARRQISATLRNRGLLET